MLSLGIATHSTLIPAVRGNDRSAVRFAWRYCSLQVQLAWRIFFPEQPRTMSPKEEGKQRLRMILVADR